MIQLKDTNAYAIPVPDKAKRQGVGAFCKDEDVKFQISKYTGMLNFYFDTYRVQNIFNVELPEGNYTILGTATKEHISFDATKVVLHKEINGYDYHGLTYIDIYKNYLLSDRDYEISCDQFGTPEDSFDSLMQASGCYYENPYGEIEPISDRWIDGKFYHVSAIKHLWQKSQKNTSEKWVIIKKVE